jgi:hypothetical protein
VFFTATSMIGFIALAGIIVRNSILLVDFIDIELRKGRHPSRTRCCGGRGPLPPDRAHRRGPVVVGLVICLDPIFQGLAVSLIFGVIVSTALTLVVIPLLYYPPLMHKPMAPTAQRHQVRLAVAPSFAPRHHMMHLQEPRGPAPRRRAPVPIPRQHRRARPRRDHRVVLLRP